MLRRIALFQYEWPLQAQTVNFARALAAAGTRVDLFLKACRRDLVDEAALAAPGIAVHEVSGDGRLEGLRARLERRFAGVDRHSVHAAAATGAHDLYIGIEKRGLVWAGRLAERTGIPLVYYSLELYDDNHPDARRIPGYYRLRALEKHHHARAAATIVQDQARGEWLLRANGLAQAKLIYLPVSVEGEPNRTSSDLLRRMLGISADRTLVLYFGLISEERGCVELAAQVDRLGPQAALVLHGYGTESDLRRVREASGGRAYVSTSLTEQADVPALVASADVGLAFYRPGIANDELTAASSEKIALYCQAGVPFVARDTASYRELVRQFPCAELVAGAEGVPAAVQAILAGRNRYREAAWSAFEARYRFGAHAARVIGELRQLQQRRTGSSPSSTSNTPRA